MSRVALALKYHVDTKTVVTKADISVHLIGYFIDSKKQNTTCFIMVPPRGIKKSASPKMPITRWEGRLEPRGWTQHGCPLEKPNPSPKKFYYCMHSNDGFSALFIGVGCRSWVYNGFRTARVRLGTAPARLAGVVPSKHFRR